MSRFSNLTVEEHCKDIIEMYNTQKRNIETLIEENKKLKEEKYKDTELAHMKAECDRMKEDYYRGFPISEEEYEKALNWMDDHEATKHTRCKGLPRGGAIGGSYQWIFTPTSIGTFGTIKCSCGEKFNFMEEI